MTDMTVTQAHLDLAIMIISVALLVNPVAALGPAPGCQAVAGFPCLPGLDAIGIGYDAVTGGFSGSQPVVLFNFTRPGNFYPNPFDNGTSYSYPDQTTVRGHSEKTTSHSVYRSVSDYVSSQSHEAHASAHAGGFFKASVETKWASSHMSDSLHIVAVSEYEVGVYSIALQPPPLLKAHPDMLAYIDMLPEAYDDGAYQNFITYYGTHYPFQVTLGGRARMKTVISNAFSSTHSDSSITASVHASWCGIGGGGGASSSSSTTSQEWENSTDIVTETVGGDPAISAFSNATTGGQGWADWVKSVERGAPVVTSMQLEPVWSLVPPGPKQDNVIKAVQLYASNATWPAANLSQYMMSWCDCDVLVTNVVDFNSADMLTNGCGDSSFTVHRCSAGKVFVEQQLGHSKGYVGAGCSGNTIAHRCCRPCFTAQN